uniref:Putative secreted protein n=1 Tax=Anopheles marajoara TaxID=58244 RepID=A0A2M4CFP6_9DIPT
MPPAACWSPFFFSFSPPALASESVREMRWFAHFGLANELLPALVRCVRVCAFRGISSSSFCLCCGD